MFRLEKMDRYYYTEELNENLLATWSQFTSRLHRQLSKKLFHLRTKLLEQPCWLLPHNLSFETVDNWKLRIYSSF